MSQGAPSPTTKSKLIAPTTPPKDVPSPLALQKLTISGNVDLAILEGVVPQDRMGDGPKLLAFSQMDVAGRALLIKMGQVDSQGIVQKAQVTEFEKHVR